MENGPAGEIESEHLLTCEKYADPCGRCGMLMNGGGERATHNCINRLRGSLIKVARMCSDRGDSVPEEFIPVTTLA